jgi:predicted nucleic acid-binding protein
MSVVDASFLSAFYAPSDTSHASAQGWYEGNDPPLRLWTPAIALAELGAGLRQQGASTERAREALETVEDLVSIVPVDTALASRAAALALERTIRGCDAVYVALAERLDDELVAFDRQQARGAEGVVAVRQL